MSEAAMEQTPEEVSGLLRAGGPRPLLIDCRTEEEWRVSRIGGAVHIPMEQVAERAEEVLGLLDREPGRPVIVYCHHGHRSLRAAMVLRQHEVPAASMSGGIEEWSVRIDPGVPRYERGPWGCRVIPASPPA